MALTGQKLSGSTNGRGIKVVATTTLGTSIHSGHATATDYVTVYAFNSAATPQLLTLEWGGVTVPDDLIKVSLNPNELTLVAPKLPLTNVNVTAFAETTNVVMIFGSVDRVT